MDSEMLYQRLEDFDPEIDLLIRAEEDRQRNGLQLIASENFASVSVLQAGSSVLANKYSEGQVGKRYYGGNEYIDAIETLCKKRALELFGLDSAVWDVNVQALSGTAANLAVYTALAGRDGKLMGLDLPSGGHLSHGYQTPTKKISASSLFFESRSYKCGKDGLIDYDQLAADAGEFKPDILICGGSAYPGDFDYSRLREIAGSGYLMMDMAHISGLVAAGLMKSPFEHCDVVTTTTHKILRGPRSAMIFYRQKVNRNGVDVDVKTLIDSAVFPGLQGGPHNQKIGALAVALKQASTDSYKGYAKAVCDNAQAMAAELKRLGYRLSAGGTQCHLLLVSLEGVGGHEVEKACEAAGIYLNRNCVATDKSPLRPSAIRIGTPALTTRGLGEADFIAICGYLDEVIKIAREFSGAKDFDAFIAKDERLASLKTRVREFLARFPIPVYNYRRTHSEA